MVAELVEQPLDVRRGGAGVERADLELGPEGSTVHEEVKGVRDVGDLSALARRAGLTLADIVPMPANNLVLAFARPDRQN